MKKLLCITLALVMLLSAVHIGAFAAYSDVSAVSSQNRVYIKGTLPSDSGEKITMICADKDTAVEDGIDPTKIVYIDEIEKAQDGSFEVTFDAGKNITQLDIYMNDSNVAESTAGTKSKLTNLKDYGASYYFDTTIDKTVIDNLNYKLDITLGNVLGYTDVDCDILIACYDKNKVLLNVTSESYGSFGAKYSKEFTAPQGTYTAKAFVWVNMKPVVNAIKIDDQINTIPYDGTNIDEAGLWNITANTRVGAEQTAWIAYNGRWQEYTSEEDGHSHTHMLANWTRANLRFRVKGKDAKLVFGTRGSTARIIVNGKVKNLHVLAKDNGSNNGEIDLKNYLTDGVVNDVMVIMKGEGTRYDFCGIELGKGTVLYKPLKKDLNMMFIGDSITAWSTEILENSSLIQTDFSYSYLVPTELDADFTTIARSGISLYRPLSVYSAGMIDQFKQYGSYIPKDDTTGENEAPKREEDYDFSKDKDKFDLIFINLGTNDIIKTVDTDFIEKYAEFVTILKTNYPSANIVIIKPFHGNNEERNWDMMNQTFDKIKTDIVDVDNSGKLYFCDTADLTFDYATEYCKDDNLHPNGAGHEKIKDYIINWLKSNNLI